MRMWLLIDIDSYFAVSLYVFFIPIYGFLSICNKHISYGDVRLWFPIHFTRMHLLFFILCSEPLIADVPFEFDTWLKSIWFYSDIKEAYNIYFYLKFRSIYHM